MGGIQQQQWTPTKRRGPIAAEYSSPGPACVTLPNLIGVSSVPDSKRGRAPAFSFGSRHGNKNDSPGPGPGQYNVTGLSAKGKDNPLAATLHSRPKEVRADLTPAPGDYNLEKSEGIMHDTSPKYTFGLKTQVEKPSQTPGPGSYNNAKADNYKAKAPAYSISSRYQMPSDSTMKPGPGAHSPEKARLDNLPAHTFGIKHSPYAGCLKDNAW
ncbi:outer dense fiber protein 3-like isoform X2 [Zootermopsis nevadensis]|uniref:outer dense fiber protein 3-like isoform X2 n=1 Tax=Zootermopsis nevadensis TaxID=136037 RepID=UPI000B8ECC97|nr:outer dense fiber protein 3-like isoform X2 [Zootermopsis nevadensis]